MFCCVDVGVVGGPLHCCYYYFVALVVLVLAIALLVLLVAFPNTCLIQPSHRLLLLFLCVASHYSHFVTCVLVSYYPHHHVGFLVFFKRVFL